MQYSKKGIALTEQFESCSLTAYHGKADKPGVWTIGWGHTGPEVVEGLVWTQDQCDSQLVMDTHNAECAVNRLVTVPLTQGEFDALVDFCFNCGSGNFKSSTMLKLINAGNYQDAANEFEKWQYSNGQKVAGLLRRRLAEKQEFNQ